MLLISSALQSESGSRMPTPPLRTSTIIFLPKKLLTDLKI